ncbi:MAG: CapA family protein [Dysgonamonadaceae bacterium]|nr:CapA family protein [Dysgonamonadaceae bacterium]
MTYCIIHILLLFSMSIFSQEKKEAILLFAGDAMQHDSQIRAARKGNAYDYSSYFKYIKDKISSADLSVVNLEATLGGKPYKGYPCFSAPDEYALALKDAGFNLFLTANNHCLDTGKKGLERTIAMLDSFQINYTGTFPDKKEREKLYPKLMEINGIRIALLNYTYGTNGIETQSPNIVNYIDKQAMLEDINQAKAMNAEIIIACMHWGEEYKLVQNKAQENIAGWMKEQGVRLIIGSHPHVIQPIHAERNEEGSISNLTIYSLGNFVSGMTARNTDGGLMVEIRLSKKNQQVDIESVSYELLWRYRNKSNGEISIIPVSQAETLDLGENKTPILSGMKTFVNTVQEIFEKYNTI